MIELYQLSQYQYSTLEKIGLLYEFYPSATGNWYTDTNKNPTEPSFTETVSISKTNVTSEVTSNGILFKIEDFSL